MSHDHRRDNIVRSGLDTFAAFLVVACIVCGALLVFGEVAYVYVTR